MPTTRKWCIWCTASPVREDHSPLHCSKECLQTHKADPCYLCKKNPGRVFWQDGYYYCTICCKQELLRVQEECAKIKYREWKLEEQ